VAGEDGPEKMMVACEEKGPGRPKAKALGYQPLVLADFFAGLKSCAPSEKQNSFRSL
jgi:hypothetical protein